MTRKLKTLLLILISVLMMLILSVIFVPYNFNIPEDSLKNEYDNGLVFSGLGVPIPDGFKYVSSRKDYKLILSKFSLDKPVYTLVYSLSDKSVTNKYNIEVIQYQRKNLIQWNILSHKSGYFLNSSFDQAVSLASKYDLSIQNPKPENITVFEPLQPSTNPSLTANANPEVIVPNSQGVSTK